MSERIGEAEVSFDGEGNPLGVTTFIPARHLTDEMVEKRTVSVVVSDDGEVSLEV